MIFTSWKELIEKVSALNEEELRHSINEESPRTTGSRS